MTNQSNYLKGFIETNDLDSFKDSLMKELPNIILRVEEVESIIDEMYTVNNTQALDYLIKLAALVENAILLTKEKRKYKGWYRFIRDVEVQVDFYDWQGKLIEKESKVVVYKKGSYIKDLTPYFSIWDNTYGATVQIKEEDLERIDFNPAESTYYVREWNEFVYVDNGIRTTDIVH